MENLKNEKQFKSAYEKAAEEGIDPRCIPQKLVEAVPEGDTIDYPKYSLEDQETWQILYSRQMELLQGRVCNEYLEGAALMEFSEHKIPSLKTLSTILKKTSNWTLARVPGLIHEENFFDFLRKRIFPSTDYIRGRHEIDYTPAPDLFHDIFGHMPLLTNKNFANFYQMFGKAALNAKPEQHIFLERFHWFTVEFGLISQPEGNKIYGAGIISSKNEVQHALSKEVKVIHFDPELIIRQEYEVWHLQPLLFVIDSFEQLEEGFKSWIEKEGLI
jgi:phenylalanine-4-hydroxylase